MQPSSKLFLSAITLLELDKGIQTLERRVPSQGGALRVWLAGGTRGVCWPNPAIHREHGSGVRFTARARPPLRA